MAATAIVVNTGPVESKKEPNYVYVWGRGGDGQLGHGDHADQSTPKLLQLLNSLHVVQVHCGGKHSAAVTAQGDVYSWGWNQSGQLGMGDVTDALAPRLLKHMALFRALHNIRLVQTACGGDHTLILDDNGGVYSCGADSDGQLGHGEGYTALIPRVVLGLHREVVVQLSAGGGHNLALTDAGVIWSWGRGRNGRLGHGSEEVVTRPKVVKALSDVRVVQVACGWSHSMAVTDNGAVYSWGCGADGRLGHGDEDDCPRPRLVDSFGKKRCVQVAAGYYHSSCLMALGDVYCWGWGEHGQLGHGSTSNVTKPKVVKDLCGARVSQIAGGGFHSVARTESGCVWVWGNGVHGQLGIADAPEKQLVPIQLPQFGEHAPATHVAAGWWHTTAVSSSPVQEEAGGEGDAASSDTVLNAVVMGPTPLALLPSLAPAFTPEEVDMDLQKLREAFRLAYGDAEVDHEEEEDEAGGDPGAPGEATASTRRTLFPSTGVASVRGRRYSDDEDDEDGDGDEGVHVVVQCMPASGKGAVSVRVSNLECIERKCAGAADSSMPTVRSASGKQSPMQKVGAWLSSLIRRPRRSADTEAHILARRQLGQQEREERTWLTEIVPKWESLKQRGKLHALVRGGVPPGVRGAVWRRAIGNKLNVTQDVFADCLQRAAVLRTQGEGESAHQNAQRLIEQDLPRTFPKLQLFHKHGPFYEQLTQVLEAFAAYKSDLGYVQGMSFLSAMLMLHMDQLSTFICLCNLVNNHFFVSLFQLNIREILRHVKVYELLFSKHLPRLYKHFKHMGISPEHYLLDWFFAVFSKALPFPVCCRVWDSFLVEGEVFLFRTALAILKCFRERLMAFDLHECVHSLRKLPDEISEEDLFDAIEKLTVPTYVHQLIRGILDGPGPQQQQGGPVDQ